MAHGVSRIATADLVLGPPESVDSAIWDETRYEFFLDELCLDREYQKDAIRSALKFLLGGEFESLAQFAEKRFDDSEALRTRYGSWKTMRESLGFPDLMACSLDLATGTGKSFVLYGLAAIMLAEGVVDKVLVLCPSRTIEDGLLEKFGRLAADENLSNALPSDSKFRIPGVIRADESIVTGSICVENYHAILKHVKSSIRECLSGQGERTLILNDEAHHLANTKNDSGKWRDFVLDPEFGFKYVVGASGTCFHGDDYFADVIYRFSLRDAVEQKWVKNIEYVAEMPTTSSPEEKWQLVSKIHSDQKKALSNRSIKPLTIVVTRNVASCKAVCAELVEWLQKSEGLEKADAEKRVLAVSSDSAHSANLRTLKSVDNADNPVEWIVSVSMLSEGWDVANVFQIVPHEERAFNSRLLIAQVLGRGLRRPFGWQGADPVVTVFNHDAWSTRIKHLVNEILEIEQRISCLSEPDSKFDFVLDQLEYERSQTASTHAKPAEYKFLESGFVDLPTQVESQEVTVEFERAFTGARRKVVAETTSRTYTIDEVAERMFRALEAIDGESADTKEPTGYAKKFNMARCKQIVEKSLERAGIKSGRVTEENRQRFLKALGPLRRSASRRVVYESKPADLRQLKASDRGTDSCSAIELGSKRKGIFYTQKTVSSLPDDQRDFFLEATDPDGEFAGASVHVSNLDDFRAPMILAIADSGPERKFVRQLVTHETALLLDGWVKGARMNFYPIEYSWKKGVHTKRGTFNPDFFIALGTRVFVVEIKDDTEIDDISMENVRKHEFAFRHFAELNKELKLRKLDREYHFNMLTPRDFPKFFTSMKNGKLGSFRSSLDVAAAAEYSQ